MYTYLAIDLGTSNCRSAVFDENMQMLSISSKEYPLINLSSEMIEQDANLWWDAVKQTIKEAVRAAGAPGKKVCSISISSQGIAFVPIDKEGNTLYNAISWLDMRASSEEQDIEDEYGIKTIFDITGKRANGCYTLSKLLWFMKNHRDIYEKAYKILLPMDFIIYKFCKNAVTDHTMAGGTMFYDINTQYWSQKILSEQHIDEEKLPSIQWSGRSAGVILPDIADELGLGRNVIIALGAQDQKCAALGAGISADSATASLGTASCITLLSDRPVKDDRLRIPCFSYLYQGAWSFEGIINTAASSYQWFRNNFARNYSYKELDSLAQKAAQKSDRAYFYPYLAGMTSPFWGNGTGCFSGLSLGSDVGQLALSVMDGVSCNIKANLDIMQCAAKPVSELRLFGGGAASPIWCQLTADITNLNVVTLSSPETALLGAAMLARKAKCGSLPILHEKTNIFSPIPENVAFYKDYYKKYLEGLNRFDYN